MLYSLQELGWQYVGPTLFLNNHGEEIKLTEGEPRRLQQLMERTLEEQHEAAVVQALHRRKGVTESELKQVDEYGIDFEAIRKAVKSKKTSRRGAHIITQLAAGTYPVGARLKQIGVHTDMLCPLCEDGEDTVKHRVWHCPGLAEARANAYQKEPWGGAEQVGSIRF